MHIQNGARRGLFFLWFSLRSHSWSEGKEEMVTGKEEGPLERRRGLGKV